MKTNLFEFKTPSELLAFKIHSEHYREIFNADSDLSEEILISLLARKHSIITLKHMINVCGLDIYKKALEIIEKEY